MFLCLVTKRMEIFCAQNGVKNRNFGKCIEIQYTVFRSEIQNIVSVHEKYTNVCIVQNVFVVPNVRT